MKDMRAPPRTTILLGLALLAVAPLCAQGAYVKRATARETYAASRAAASGVATFGPWHVIGPFDSTNGAGFAASYPPEAKIDLQAAYPGKGDREVRWQRGAFRDGEVNSLALFPDNENIAAYLFRTITVPQARDLPVALGSDDTLTVWLNGEQLLAHNVGRACILGDERLTLKLRAGKNELLLKVCQGGGPCGFAFAVDDGGDQLLSRIAADFPGQINDLLLERDWLRQAQATKTQPGASITPEDDAPGACDGVKNGGTGFHTQLEDRPWWQVDLGQVQPLDHALLYNREDCAGRIARVLMLLSDDGQSWRQVWQNDGTVFHGGTDGKPMRVALPGQRARYVRLQQPGREFLHLDEVEVYGPADPETNLALDRPATQSSSSPWSTRTPYGGPRTADAAADRARYRAAAQEALSLAQQTLAFVQAEKPLPDAARKLADLQQVIAAAPPAADWQDLYLRTRRLRREIILSHPLLDFERLLVVKRGPTLYSHMVDQYEGRHSQPGDGLVMLQNWKTQPQADVLLRDRLPRGTVGHPDLSFDGQRVVFSYCDNTVEPREKRRFFLYELDLESHEVRQITGKPGVDPLQGWEGRDTVLIEDFDPCYLPDGGIMFVSTRNQGFGRCHGGRYTPAYVLYRCEADGSKITRLSYGEANEWNPNVLADGQIIYTRWDYINRHDTVLQSLWTTRPDGAATAHYYANSTRNPCMAAQARAIPGSDLIVALAMAHHSYSAGSIFTVDRRRGEEGLDPVTRITPESSFPETEGWSVGSYTDPYPLSADLFLAAYDPNPLITQGKVAKPDGYGIYLVDTLGGRELLYRDPTTCCFAPLPVQPRPRPPVLPSALTPGQADGVFIIQNVYNSFVPLAPGSVKALRVVAMHDQPTASAAERSAVSQEIVKSVVGTVPVAADGAVAFRAPAQRPLLFQLLDEHGVSLFSMRSQVYLQPGEMMSCAGCHEPRGSSPLPRPVGGAFSPDRRGGRAGGGGGAGKPLPLVRCPLVRRPAGGAATTGDGLRGRAGLPAAGRLLRRRRDAGGAGAGDAGAELRVPAGDDAAGGRGRDAVVRRAGLPRPPLGDVALPLRHHAHPAGRGHGHDAHVLTRSAHRADAAPDAGLQDDGCHRHAQPRPDRRPGSDAADRPAGVAVGADEGRLPARWRGHQRVPVHLPGAPAGAVHGEGDQHPARVRGCADARDHRLWRGQAAAAEPAAHGLPVVAAAPGRLRDVVRHVPAQGVVLGAAGVGDADGAGALWRAPGLSGGAAAVPGPDPGGDDRRGVLAGAGRVHGFEGSQDSVLTAGTVRRQRRGGAPREWRRAALRPTAWRTIQMAPMRG